MDNDKGADASWITSFDERQRGLIQSCRQYVTDGAPGLPGHQLMLIVARMATIIDALVEGQKEKEK